VSNVFLLTFEAQELRHFAFISICEMPMSLDCLLSVDIEQGWRAGARKNL
jgi:hypothetical protein